MNIGIMSNPQQSNGTSDRNVAVTKTLYIKPLTGKLQRDEIICHFSAFGDVRSIRIRNKKKHSYGFVKFAQAESTTRALEIDFHVIAGRRVKIALAHDRHQGGATNDGPSISVLNDDCIHEILSTECLSALDLCSVAETSRRLKDIAGRVFRRKHTKCDILSLANRKVKSAQRILRNFGAVISDLKISGWYFGGSGTSVLDSVAKYCSNTLESLYLRECVIPNNLPAELRALFNNLQKLKIDSCRVEGSNEELFADSGSLVELELSGGSVEFIIENNFPKLQKFKYGAADEMNLDSFILRHKNLTSIAFSDTSSLLPIIGDNCKQLEELEFSISGDKSVDLSNFGHLRKLNLFCGRGHQNVMKKVKGWNNLQFLENLTLQWAICDSELIQILSQLKRLQVLKLECCSGLVVVDFVALIKRLSNLKVLSVGSHEFKMDLETYLRIVDVVRARPDKSKLIFQLNNNRPQHYDDDMLHNFSLNADVVEMITGE